MPRTTSAPHKFDLLHTKTAEKATDRYVFNFCSYFILFAAVNTEVGAPAEPVVPSLLSEGGLVGKNAGMGASLIKYKLL